MRSQLIYRSYRAANRVKTNPDFTKGAVGRCRMIAAYLPLVFSICCASCTEEVEDGRRHERHKLRIKLDRAQGASFDHASLSRECARARWPFQHRQQNR